MRSPSRARRAPGSPYSIPAGWSPASRDPRFRRHTPDRIRARLAAAQPVAGRRLGLDVWIIHTYTTRALKMLIVDPERYELLANPEQKVEAIEATLIEKKSEVKLATPAPAMPARAERPCVRESGRVRESGANALCLVSAVRWYFRARSRHNILNGPAQPPDADAATRSEPAGGPHWSKIRHRVT